MKHFFRIAALLMTLLLAGAAAACASSDAPAEPTGTAADTAQTDSDTRTADTVPDGSAEAEQTDAPTEPETDAPTEAPTETPTEPPTEADTAPETLPANAMQLIPDREFRTGMEQISQKDHSNHDKFSVLKTHSFYGDEAKNPVWRLAQWDSGPDMVAAEVDEGPTVITDGQYRTFGYDPETDVMTFHLDTSLYYQGKPAVNGDYWPHLLIEQGDFGYKSMSDEQKAYYSCACDRIILSMDIRLTGYKNTPHKDDWVDAAQFLLYFYVKGVNTNDFCWFGVQLFDNRWSRNANYIGYDGGKADASGAMIFSIGSQFVYPSRANSLWKSGKPNPEGDWVHIELDIRPFLDQMLAAGKSDGYFKADTLEELCINGMNMGWETIASFDHTMQVRNFRLVSYIDE